jgi:hypothetical protein
VEVVRLFRLHWGGTAPHAHFCGDHAARGGSGQAKEHADQRDVP